jgi:hypothetical protein
MQAEQQSERERFEAWFEPYWSGPQSDLQAWAAWQARAALSHPSPQGWPCEVVEADFSENTVTLQMKDAGYLVSAGEYRLIPPPEQGSKG